MGIFLTIIAIALIGFSALGLVIAARLQGMVANLLAWLITAYAMIVLLAQLLSELHTLSRAGFLIGHTLIAAAVVGWYWRSAAHWPWKNGYRLVQMRLKAYDQNLRALPKTHPALAVLGTFVALALLLGVYLILRVPPNSTDGLFYHLPRVAQWLHSGTLRHFPTALPQRTVFPINAEVGFLWLTTLSGSDRLAGFWQWLLTILTMVAIYGVARRLQFAPAAGGFAALLWSTLTIVVVQATAVKNDIVVTFFVMAAFYFLLAGLQEQRPAGRIHFIFFGLALGLALGAKSVTWLLLPPLGVMGLILLVYRPRHFWPKLLYAALCLGIGFLLVGAYNYALNWFNYRSPLGGAEVSEAHLIEQPTWPVFAANLARIGYDLFDLSGLPDPLVEAIRPQRGRLGEQLFARLGLEPNPAGTNFSREFDFYRGVLPPYEKNAWYGPLGALLLLPALLFYLLISPLTEKDLWKWLTALVVLLFVLSFAALVRWQTQLGRLLLVGMTLNMPLLAGFYGWSERVKPLRWATIGLAVIVLVWSATHNHHKPLFGPTSIWSLDDYALRLIQRPSLAPIARYVDTNLPERGRLGLAGEEAFRPDRTDYLFWGPHLRREVVYAGPLPGRIDPAFFTTHHLDYLIFATDTPASPASDAPVWPIGQDREARWFLVKGDEMTLFTGQVRRVEQFQTAFGRDYQAYTQILAALKQSGQPYRVLTTDPRMPYYDPAEAFVFNLPANLDDLHGFTHLVISPQWSSQNYQDFAVSFDQVQTFLAQEQFVREVFNSHGYTVYQILF